MKTVKKIGAMSLAKVQAIITGIMYFLVGIVMSLASMVSPEIMEGSAIPSGIMGVVGLTISGILLGFVTGLLLAGIYNYIVPKVGGVQIELK